MTAIVTFAKERGIRQVHDRNAIIYADPATDITAEIIKRLDGGTAAG